MDYFIFGRVEEEDQYACCARETTLIFFVLYLSLLLPLIQEGQLSVSGERMCTILVNCLED